MQTLIKSLRHVRVRLSWVPLLWQWESWHHHAPFPPLFSDRAKLFSLLKWAQCIPGHFALCPVFLSLCILLKAQHVHVMDTRACLKRQQVCRSDLSHGKIKGELLSTAKLLDLWNICHGTVARKLHSDTKHWKSEIFQIQEWLRLFYFFPNCFRKLAKVNLTTLRLHNNMNSRGGKKWKEACTETLWQRKIKK